MLAVDPLTAATWTLVLLTGGYAFLTFRLVSATKRQLEAANLPYVIPSLTREPDRTLFRLENPGLIPAYDVDLLVLGHYSEADMDLDAFLSRFVAVPQEAGQLRSADGGYGVRDRISYALVPGRMGVEAATAFPLPPSKIEVMVQYKGPLGINYSQLFCFSFDDDSAVFRTTLLDPTQPAKCVRVHAPGLETPRGRRLPPHFTRRPVRFAESFRHHAISAGQLSSPSFAGERGEWFPLTR
jgi:hypothetical protein